MAPFISFYTPTYNRPRGLADCMASVRTQTAIADIEHLIFPDYVGIGIDGMYARVPEYAPFVHGWYVHLLADDDMLAGPDVVERLKTVAMAGDYPPVIIVGANKGWLTLPLDREGPPVCGRIDLGCLVVRGDIWKQHAGDYGKRYEGDFDMANALWNAGHHFHYAPELLFLRGGVSRGAAEVAA